MGKYLLGVDLGTSGLKAALINHGTNEILYSDLYSYPTIFKKLHWAEQEPNKWWESFCKATKKIIGILKINSKDIEAVGISSQGCGVVCIDKDGKPLGEAMIWMDSRAGKQCKWLKKNYSEIISKYNENPLTVLFSLPNILWLYDNRPDVIKKTKCICGVSSYINYRLTGMTTVNPSEASLVHLFDVTESKWSKELCDLLKISMNILPKTCNCTDIIGTVTKEAENDTGLKMGTPVIGGGHDTTSAAFSIGVINEGQAFYSMGTGGNLGVIVENPRYTSKTTCQNYVIQGKWIFNTVMTSAGSCLKWFLDEFGKLELSVAKKQRISPYTLFDQDAKQSKPGSSGLIFTPYLAGEMSPIWDINARACFIGITNKSKRKDIIRAIMEGVCLSVFQNMEILERKGCNISEIRVTGGPSKSKIWMQILADITGKKIIVSDVEHAAPLGDALLAGISIGVYKDYSQAVKETNKISKIFNPIKKNKIIYNKLFDVYKKIYINLKNEFEILSKF